MARILLIDDEGGFPDLLQELLEEQGHDLRWLDAAAEALELLTSGEPFDLILLDNKMPCMSGLEFLEVSARLAHRIPVILITSAHNDSTAIQAVNLGADAYAIKPLTVEDARKELVPLMRKILDLNRPAPPVQLPRPEANNCIEESSIVGRSRVMLDVLTTIGRLARVHEPVLILGETGTGKDLVARAIHTNSPRRSRPFAVMNCAAFNDQLLDDELFGHEPGAFTGALKLRKGYFEYAHGGTLFLDEVGDMPATLQVKLLRALEYKEITRIGSNEPIRVDVRILAATHRDLKKLVREEKFRQDLFFRLEGMTVHLPPLRERKEDIELLVRTFLGRMFGSLQAAPALHPQALQCLRDYGWPGNIRQLQKTLCRAVGNCRGAQILATDFDFGEFNEEAPAGQPEDRTGPGGLRAAVAAAWEANEENVWPALEDAVRKELIRFALSVPGMSQVRLSRRLGISRNYLRDLIKQYGFEEADRPE